MAKEPGVSATSRIIAQSQTNIHYYSDLPKRLQQIFGGFQKRFQPDRYRDFGLSKHISTYYI
jgi:hypothetical protein